MSDAAVIAALGDPQSKVWDHFLPRVLLKLREQVREMSEKVLCPECGGATMIASKAVTREAVRCCIVCAKWSEPLGYKVPEPEWETVEIEASGKTPKPQNEK